MKDLVERLRAYSLTTDSDVLIDEAAATLESLTAQLAEARAELATVKAAMMSHCERTGCAIMWEVSPLPAAAQGSADFDEFIAWRDAQLTPDGLMAHAERSAGAEPMTDLDATKRVASMMTKAACDHAETVEYMRGLLRESLTKFMADWQIRAKPDYASNLMPRIEAAIRDCGVEQQKTAPEGDIK